MASPPHRFLPPTPARPLPLRRHRVHGPRQRLDDDMAEAGVYLVPADDAPCTSASVRLLTDKEQSAAAQLPHVTLPHILYTASVLVKQRNCPVDVVSSILEFAGMFLSFHGETQERVYGRDNMNQEYVRLDLPSPDELELPEGIAVSRCILLTIECATKDQGWASADPELNGTYQGSCTWLEVAVHKPAAAPTADAQHITDKAASDATARDSEAAGDDEDHDARKDAETVEAARTTVLYNVRAHRSFRHHLKCFQDPQGLIRHVELGDSVRLFLHSQYPGWANSAKFGKVSAFFALEFDEELSFADVSFPEPPASGAAAGEDGDSPYVCALL